MYSKEKFVLHKHDAFVAGTHLDLRIQIPHNNLLMSWAIPSAKIPENPGDRVLAVEVNKHGQYWLFIKNMEIPKGEYGGGKITLIQTGTLEIEGWGKTHITFKSTKGSPLNGRYTLHKIKSKNPKDKDNIWMFSKTKDQ